MEPMPIAQPICTSCSRFAHSKCETSTDNVITVAYLQARLRGTMMSCKRWNPKEQEEY